MNSNVDEFSRLITELRTLKRHFIEMGWETKVPWQVCVETLPRKKLITLLRARLSKKMRKREGKKLGL